MMEWPADSRAGQEYTIVQKIHRIGYFVSSYPARSHTFVRREIAALIEQGFEVERFSLRRMGESEVMDATDKFEFDHTTPVLPFSVFQCLAALVYFSLTTPYIFLKSFIYAVSSRQPGIKNLKKSLRYFAGGLVLAKLLKKREIQFLHVHFANSGAHIGSIAAKILRLKWGISVHGLSDFSYPSVLSMPYFAENAEFIRCISKFGRSQAMLNSDKKNWGKIFVAYSGIDAFTGASDAKADNSKLDRPLTIINVGRLSPEKGHQILLNACSRLMAEGANFKCIIVGEGPSRAEIQTAIRELSLENICFLIGAVPETQVRNYLADSDVFVLTSLMEGVPQVLIEAMQVGIPVVAPNVSGIPELVFHEKDGLLYPPADEEALIDALKKLMNNRELRKEIAKTAQRKVASAFTISSTILPLAERLRSL